MEEKIKISTLKAKCLSIVEKVKKNRRQITITKRNIPIAKIVPIEEKETKVFGKLKGTVHIKGDIIAPIGEEWNANS